MLTRSDVDDGALDDAHRVVCPALVRGGVDGRGVLARVERQQVQRPVVRRDGEDVAVGGRRRDHAVREAETMPRDDNLSVLLEMLKNLFEMFCLKFCFVQHNGDFGTYRLWMAARAAFNLRPGRVGESELIGRLFRKVEVAAGSGGV